jgi:hypothetical protein
MKSVTNLLSASVAVALSLSACGGSGTTSVTNTPPPPPSIQPASVPPLVRVSTSSPYPAGCGGHMTGSVSYQNAEVEPYVAVNPVNTANIVGVWQQDRWSDGGAHGLVAGYSMDGGKTWKENPLPFSICASSTGLGAGYGRASDPWVTFSPDGSAVYAISISFNGAILQPGSSGGVFVTRSADGGSSWSPPVALIIDGDTTFSDKESVTADPNDAHFVYAVWDRLTTTGLGATYFSRSIDGGTSWQAAAPIWDPGVNNQTIGNEIVGLTSGEIVDVFEQVDNTSSNSSTSSIRVIRSSDHGASWSAPTIVAQNLAVGTQDPDTGAIIRAGAGLPQAAAGPGNELVVVWQDARFSSGQRDGVLLSRSTDAGLTWSTPVQINTVTSVPAFTPSVAVLADGTVGVSYFDFRDDTPARGTLPTDYWFVSSTDLSHWSEQHITGPFDLDLAPEAEGLFLGDYQALAVISNVFVPFYVQTNAGNLQNRNDAYFLPPQPVPLVLTRQVTRVVTPSSAASPDGVFRQKVHENLMQLLRSENPGWDKVRENRRSAASPP